MNAPFIFFHINDDPRLEYIFRQARHSNPGREIILLGNDKNSHYASLVKWLNCAEYAKGWQAFLDIYAHMTTNSYTYETICFLRWYSIRDYMEKNGISAAFCLDTDVMIYSDFNTLEQEFSELDCVTGYFEDVFDEEFFFASPAVTYITLKHINIFCSIVMDAYTQKKDYLRKYWLKIKDKGAFGGVSDMLLLGMHIKLLRSRSKFKSCFSLIQGKLFDHCMTTDYIRSSSEKFQMENGIKRICFANGVPYAHETNANKAYAFHALHFQGLSKKFIPQHYTGPEFL